jgi:hypothetical protein
VLFIGTRFSNLYTCFCLVLQDLVDSSKEEDSGGHA